MRIYQIERTTYGRKDRVFLEKMFQKLSLISPGGSIEKMKMVVISLKGAFLALITLALLILGQVRWRLGLEQPDATGWMGMYCLNLLQIALELADENPPTKIWRLNFLNILFTLQMLLTMNRLQQVDCGMKKKAFTMKTLGRRRERY